MTDPESTYHSNQNPSHDNSSLSVPTQSTTGAILHLFNAVSQRVVKTIQDHRIENKISQTNLATDSDYDLIPNSRTPLLQDTGISSGHIPQIPKQSFGSVKYNYQSMGSTFYPSASTNVSVNAPSVSVQSRPDNSVVPKPNN